MTIWAKNEIPNLDGRIFIVTGANSGIGYESCLALAEKGGTVIMAYRNLEAGQQSLDLIQQAAPSAKLALMKLDLASLDSIQVFAKTFKSKYDKLDVLINNAGPVGADRILTADGYESHFGIGHLGHFALTGLLLDILLKTPNSRIITVGSRMHADGKIEWEDINGEKSYDRWKAYKQSKLANMLFALELNRRLEAKGASTKSLAVHPGLAKTGWAENNLSGLTKIIGKLMSLISYQSAEMGALPLIYAATASNVKPGGYYGPENDTKGYPVEVQADEVAHDESEAKKLWQLSEELTKVHFEALKN